MFYRSRDRKSIQCLGIVEATLFSKNIEEIYPLIAKRTVYSISTIKSILSKKTLVILFRYLSLNKPISYKQLKDAGINGSIQSIRRISNEQYFAITDEK